MIGWRWIVKAEVWVVIAFCLCGCSNKGKYAGKINVVVSDQLQAKGVSLVDWRYSESQKKFGVNLQASQPLGKDTSLVINISGRGSFRSGSVGEHINRGDWMDFGGSVAFGNPFDSLPESGTITIDIDTRR